MAFLERVALPEDAPAVVFAEADWSIAYTVVGFNRIRVDNVDYLALIIPSVQAIRRLKLIVKGDHSHIKFKKVYYAVDGKLAYKHGIEEKHNELDVIPLGFDQWFPASEFLFGVQGLYVEYSASENKPLPKLELRADMHMLEYVTERDKMYTIPGYRIAFKATQERRPPRVGHLTQEDLKSCCEPAYEMENFVTNQLSFIAAHFAVSNIQFDADTNMEEIHMAINGSTCCSWKFPEPTKSFTLPDIILPVSMGGFGQLFFNIKYASVEGNCVAKYTVMKQTSSIPGFEPYKQTICPSINQYRITFPATDFVSTD